MTPKEKDKERARIYRENNVEKLKAYRKARYLKNRDSILGAINTEENRAKRRERYWRDPERWRKVALADAAKNPERRRRTQNAWYAKTPALQLLRRSRSRARRVGLPFNLTLADIVVPTHCPVLDIPLVMGEGKHCPGSPSLDRIVPELGYVPGNVLVISTRANFLKSDGTPEELRRVHEYARRMTAVVEWRSAA